ncbi:biopolymer transporter ExbD [Arenicella chitinivorans]|uniref:Biopolymer transporter ExbD n=1 Tax=Arenicella chitinivorans TaxID=1329800 RepID=A0A918RZQ3_9GAMM|nr:biopolymer transporter ExbD [Arenicella chitinivorans]GHA15561.1 biopolymer transporter ExbD [Arenicella chitinivorans]
MNFGTDEIQDETGIELTPLIDVVFLLLIFFMISTTFTKETSLKINLPESSGEQAVAPPQNVEIQIGASSEYAIATGTDGSSKPLLNSNRDTLKRALSEYQNQPKLLLIIRADRKAPHEAVIKVMDVAQELGLTNITFATKQFTDS